VRNLLKKEKGFTLIEIVLVLAIAGLLLVIVFLAVSGAQKSRRDTQRKTDLSRIAAQLESYASNNNGLYPQMAGAQTWTAFWGSNYITGGNFNDPTTGVAYGNGGTGAIPAAPTAGTVYYNVGIACDGTAIGRGYRVYMGLEQGTVCRDNK
jgi:prepilin-type N-terminal cleavage/methylation domain-containing protein